MRYFFTWGSLRSIAVAAAVSSAVAVLASCSTLHESDTGANRGYNEFGTSSYKPSLVGTKGKAAAAAASSKALAKGPNRQTKYTPMVERTATGVRTVKDFTTQARGKNTKANADQVRANRAAQNSRISKSYNNENLLDR